MKLASIIVAVLTAVLLAASAACAAPAIRVEIPFAFGAGEAVLPAGQYYIQYADVHGNLLITAADGRRCGYVPFILAGPKVAQDAATGKLVFHRYGNQYFLRQLWVPGRDVASFHASKAEKEMIAQSSQSHRTVVAELIRP